jgi:hypothetical protein
MTFKDVSIKFANASYDMCNNIKYRVVFSYEYQV